MTLPKKVKYIDAVAAYEGYLTLGKVYEVLGEGASKETYKITGDDGKITFIIKTRFEIVEEIRRIKCIDNHGQSHRLTLGKVYEIIKDDPDGDSWTIRCDDNVERYFFKNRFEIITEKSPNAKLPENDLIADWKTWRDVGLQSDECACGMKREVCDYHKP